MPSSYTTTVRTTYRTPTASPGRKPKRQLLDLLMKYRGETTSGKMLLMGTLREYVRRQDPFILRDEISTVDNEQDLNVLVGVGMRGVCYYEVIKQKARCVGV